MIGCSVAEFHLAPGVGLRTTGSSLYEDVGAALQLLPGVISDSVRNSVVLVDLINGTGEVSHKEDRCWTYAHEALYSASPTIHLIWAKSGVLLVMLNIVPHITKIN